MTTGRALLLSALSEAEWQAHVIQLARRGGYCGLHLRTSHIQTNHWATLMGIHAPRFHDDHDDVFGLPDWLFARAGSPLIWAELKTVKGKLTAAQERWLALLRASGELAFCWRPTDDLAVREALR